ncbi:MAG: chemotaxis protein CheC [Enterobacterales bacterium]
METLSAFEKDSLGELLNIAMGTAASKLSEISNNEVEMSIPDVKLMTHAEYRNAIEQEKQGTLVRVSESFDGVISGEAVLLFQAGKSMDLVRAIIGDISYAEDFSELEEEVLTEIGNILLNSCVGTFSNILQKEFHTEIPEFNKGSIADIFPELYEEDAENHYILLAQVAFSSELKELEGELAVTLTLPALRTLIKELHLAFNIAV